MHLRNLSLQAWALRVLCGARGSSCCLVTMIFLPAIASLAPGAALVAVSKPQRRITALTLAQYEAKFPPREAAMARAYRSTAFTMAEISVHFGVSAKTVSRAVRLFEGALRE